MADLRPDGAHQMDVLLFPGVDGLPGQDGGQDVRDPDAQRPGGFFSQFILPGPDGQAEVGYCQHIITRVL